MLFVVFLFQLFFLFLMQISVTTGMDHWSTLLRSRAIETQCYVVAAAQTGVHSAKRSSYGHAMIIDPWGAVIAQCSEGNSFAVGLIDKQVLANTRMKLPIWTDRRSDIYGEIGTPLISTSIDEIESYQFGSVRVNNFQVFLKTNYTFAFVDHRPLLPGHVLVAPLRPSAKRLSDLSPQERSDFFMVVQKVQVAVENVFNAKSSTLAIQDGIDAGQSIEHLHCHIVPRKADDFGGDMGRLYAELQNRDKEKESKVPLKTREEMSETANKLRSILQSNDQKCFPSQL